MKGFFTTRQVVFIGVVVRLDAEAGDRPSSFSVAFLQCRSDAFLWCRSDTLLWCRSNALL